MSNTKMLSFYQTCRLMNNTSGSSAEAAVMECVADLLQSAHEEAQSNLVNWLLVITGAMVFFMQTGFAMLCAGCVRKKNVQNTMLKNLLDACGGAVAFYCTGFAIAFGGQKDVVGNTFMGTTNFFLTGDVNASFFFFEFAFSATSVTIIAGTLAERCQMAAYLSYSLFLTGFVYPVVAHSLWSNNGFLSSASIAPILGNGCIDFAGSGVVHVTGGTSSLIATYILGARRGRFTDSRGRPLETPKTIQGHSMALQLMGTLVLWFGWYGFNPGSALLLSTPNLGSVAAVAATNTTLCAASGGISAMLFNLYLQERKSGEYSFDLTMAMNGTLSGLVAVTAGCATIDYWAAVFVGLVAGVIYVSGSKLIIYLRLDDAVDAIPVHLFNGAWGLIATGLFSSPEHVYAAIGTDKHVGWLHSMGRGSWDATLLANQILALLFIFGWCTVTMGPFFICLNYMGWFRADSLEELVGLDFSYHGGQQNADENDRPNSKQIKAYKDAKNAKGELRKRRQSSGDSQAASMDEEGSWTDMTFASQQNGRQIPEEAPSRSAKRATGPQSDQMSLAEQSGMSGRSTFSIDEGSEY